MKVDTIVEVDMEVDTIVDTQIRILVLQLPCMTLLVNKMLICHSMRARSSRSRRRMMVVG